LPITRPAIRQGAILVVGNRIAAIGAWRDLKDLPRQQTVYLEDFLLLPGLVNAHCHLDYTHMAGHFPPPKIFTDWLKVITETKAGWSGSDYEASWLAGAEMLVQSGSTTVGDIEALPSLLPAVWQRTPLRVISFLEMIGITGRRPPGGILEEALTCLRGLKHPRSRAGLSPHAPYSTVPELLRLTAQIARRRPIPVCIHVAESALEFEMFAHGRGAMFDWLQRSGRDMSDCGQGSPVAHLNRCGLMGPDLIATHVNYLSRGDASLLARRGVHVAHCPRSHFYFRHDAFSLNRLARAGVNICLGTDSLASVYRTRRETVVLSMFEEMRALAVREPSISPRKILRMATVNGARALGLQGQAGELSRKAFADLIALPLPGRRDSLEEAVIAHRGAVAASMIDGQWAIPPSEDALRAPGRN
jgi:aminodeoxyfutalosine deaminase